MSSNPVIRALAAEAAQACADPRYARLKSMWNRHNRLEPVEKIPVCVFLHRGYTNTWQELIPPTCIVSTDPFERDIEVQLRQKLYRYHSIPDDLVLHPTVLVAPVRPPAERPLWGMPVGHTETDDPRGAYGFITAVQSEADIDKLAYPEYRIDHDATAVRVARARELVDGILPVKVFGQEVNTNPGERIVDFLGWEGFLFGLTENPKLVHRMMDFLTEGMINYHRGMEAAGMVDAEHSWWFRIHYEDLPSSISPNKLASCWVYIAAQSTGGISPDMYAEFVQPYNERLARVFGENRAYYHGCENLEPKFDVIANLPNLRRFHVSPWTSLKAAAERFGKSVVLETHCNPATTTLGLNPDQYRRDLREIVQTAGNLYIDINLSDVETVNGNPEILTTWARIAQEETGGA